MARRYPQHIDWDDTSVDDDRDRMGSRVISCHSAELGGRLEAHEPGEQGIESWRFTGVQSRSDFGGDMDSDRSQDRLEREGPGKSPDFFFENAYCLTFSSVSMTARASALACSCVVTTEMWSDPGMDTSRLFVEDPSQ